MPDEVVGAQSTPPKDTVTFALFSAANTAAAHLLDNIRSEVSPPTLIRHKKSIGYHLSAKSSSECEEEIWRIGAGPPIAMLEKDLDHLKPDIQLCPPGDSLSATIARVHQGHTCRNIFTSQIRCFSPQDKVLPSIRRIRAR